MIEQGGGSIWGDLGGRGLWLPMGRTSCRRPASRGDRRPHHRRNPRHRPPLVDFLNSLPGRDREAWLASISTVLALFAGVDAYVETARAIFDHADPGPKPRRPRHRSADRMTVAVRLKGFSRVGLASAALTCGAVQSGAEIVRYAAVPANRFLTSNSRKNGHWRKLERRSA